MSTFPAASYLNNGGRTEGEMKTGFEDFLAATKQIPGAGVAETELTISAGSVTATAGIGTFSIDTESDSASDDLTHIAQTNHPDGSYITIRPNNASRTIVVKDAQGGAGQILLAGSVDFTMDTDEHFLLLQRRGSNWHEVFRSGGGNLIYEGATGPGVIGGTLLPRARLRLSGNFTSDGSSISAALLWVDGQLTGADGDTSFLTQALIAGSIQTQTASEVVDVASTLRLGDPDITENGSTTVAKATILHLLGRPTEGGSNQHILMGDTGSGSVTISSYDDTMQFVLDVNNGNTGRYFGWYNTNISTEIMRLTETGQLLVGHAISTGSSGGDIVIPNNQTYRSLDNAGSAAVGLMHLDTSDRLVLGLGVTASSGEIRLGTAAGANARILQLFERASDPGAGGADSARIYAKDNGSGKTQLAVQFNTGAIQVLATEP